MRLLGTLLAAAGLLAVGGCAPAEPAYPPEAFASERSPAPTAASPAAAPKTIDLTSALRLAAGAHLDILDARARVREAEGRASSADGYLLPVLSVGGAVSNARGTLQSSFGQLQEGNFYTVSALGTLRISANVGESICRDLAAHRLVEAAQGYELAQVQRTLFDISVGYLALVESDATVRIQEQFVQEAQTLARLTQAREGQGLGSALDSERAKAQAASAEQRLLAARNERQRRSKGLAASLRLDSTVDLLPTDKDLVPATLVSPAESLQAWLGRAAERRPEIHSYQAAREAARNDVSAARWSVWGPEVSAGAAWGGLGKSFGSVDERESWIVSVGWTFSLGGPGRIEAAEARTAQADIALERFRDRLQASVAASFQELALARQSLDPAQREVTAAEAALRIARANYEGGLLPENDLLLAQQAADQARLRRLAVVARYNQSQLQLLADSGVATVDTLTGGAAPK
ncbi:MAG TPA: TolC family protein [Planctomycetota bacterium]|jgi:outer membrane protein TolC|nr:TolC family protein [Planctomycetota bacterium]